jgi:hypothetical protein
MTLLQQHCCLRSSLLYMLHESSGALTSTVSAQIPEEEVPRYLKNNSHLKGHDKTLLEHVVSEVMAAYGDQLAQKHKTSRDVEQDGRTR